MVKVVEEDVCEEKKKKNESGVEGISRSMSLECYIAEANDLLVLPQ